MTSAQTLLVLTLQLRKDPLDRHLLEQEAKLVDSDARLLKMCAILDAQRQGFRNSNSTHKEKTDLAGSGTGEQRASSLIDAIKNAVHVDYERAASALGVSISFIGVLFIQHIFAMHRSIRNTSDTVSLAKFFNDLLARREKMPCSNL